MPTVTPGRSNELLFIAIGSRASGPWVTSVTPGFTLEADSATSGGTSNMGIAVADRTVSTGGSYTPVVSFCGGCYKGPGNTGVHTGVLWSSTATKLATATFGDETAGGWQPASFAAPVRIAAGATYVASYHMNVGHYSYTYNGLANQIDKAPLHAPGSIASGGNGVFLYGQTVQFPDQTSRSNNYWVDLTVTTHGN